MMRTTLMHTWMLAVIVTVSGCATIVSKSSYQVSIRSQPAGAEISIADETGKVIFAGRTPTMVTLEAGAGYFKGHDYVVTFRMTGYEPHTYSIRRGVDGWYIGGNLVFGGLIGYLVVDPLTGAMWTLQTDVDVTLVPASSSSNSQGGLRVVSLDDVPRELRSRLIRI